MAKYYARYESIVANSKLANDCVQSNPYTILYEKVQVAIDEINNVDFSGWCDENGELFRVALYKVLKKLNTINSSISTCMSKSDFSFQKLYSKLEELKIVDEHYQSVYNNSPDLDDYSSYNSETKEMEYNWGGYNDAMENWRINVRYLEQCCEALCAEIEECLSLLREIDGCDIDDASTSRIAKMGIQSNSKVYTYQNQELSPYENYIINELFRKIDFSLFGYTEDQIVDAVCSSGDWTKIRKMIYYTPSNFNDFISKADMKAYSYDELLKARDLNGYKNSSGGFKTPYVLDKPEDGIYEYYSHMTEINGNMFEFLVVVPIENKDDPLTVLSYFTYEVNSVNQLSHYPSDVLEKIAIPDDQQEKNWWNSAKPWTTVHLAPELGIGGGYLPVKRDILLNTSCGFDYNTISTIDHEFGHKLDNLFGIELNLENIQLTDAYLSQLDEEWIKDLCDKNNEENTSNIEALERILYPTYVDDQADLVGLLDLSNDELLQLFGTQDEVNNQLDCAMCHLLECMAEVYKYYARYPDEFKIVAPEFYEMYNNLVNPNDESRDVTHSIVMKGQTIEPDSDDDFTLYVGGYR